MPRFSTTILQSGKNTTGIVVPDAVVAELAAGRKPAVTVTVNDYTYRSSIASMGGQFMISVSADVREKAGIKGGDPVEVTIELDTAPREVEVPADLGAALEAEPEAAAFFSGLSYSNKLRHVLSVTDAKTEETRRRRVEKAVETLKAGKK